MSSSGSTRRQPRKRASDGRARRGTTVVSVGHRPSLLQFHTHVLSCEHTAREDAPASWRWQTVAEYKQRTNQ